MELTARRLVTRIPPAPHQQAVAHFSAKLEYETTAVDVQHDLHAHRTDAGFVLVDARPVEAYAAEHIQGSVSIPVGRMAQAGRLLPSDRLIVIYCCSGHCQGATTGALALIRQGFAVKEMVGGFAAWKQAGFASVCGRDVTVRSGLGDRGWPPPRSPWGRAAGQTRAAQEA